MKNYESLLKQHKALLVGRWLTDLANTSAFIFSELSEINWVGFYLFEDSQLVLGPFQGLPACTEIAMGKGVCGTSAARRETLIVQDVHQFPGHIACDANSESEVVIPMIRSGKLLGVLDVDSPRKSRFETTDAQFFETLVLQLVGDE